ncbi:MAG TPA: SAM-dependent methyltransferase, partial [Thermoanaerobaculia bacterium]
MTRTRPGDFSPQADAYARARPGYPPELVALLIELLGVEPGAAVADLGAGTGLFTEALVRHALRV